MTEPEHISTILARVLAELRISPSINEIVEEEGRYHTALQINESFASRPDGLQKGRKKPDFHSQLAFKTKGNNHD